MKHKKVLGLILSLVLVLCVAIPGTLASENLNQPALICEKTEHVHGGGCWTVPETPACGMETGAGAHAHDGNCYGVLRGLTCTLPEDGNHTHGAECYGELKTLVCTVTEDENHTHGGECYAPKTGLVCSLAESAGHIHVESCYPTVLSCTLEEHTHDAACYAAPLSEEENEPTCTCGSADGTHVEGCPLYAAPQEPTCTCGSVDGTHVAGCPLYVAPTCTCGSVDGTHVEGCPLYVAPTCTCGSADGTHVAGCALYVAPEQPAEAEKTCTCDPAPAEGEAHKEGCPLYAAPEQPAEAEKTCTCDPKPAEGEAHLEGCPLYVKPTEENPFKELYDKLMATASIVEFTEIYAAYTDDDIAQFEKWVVENELLDSLKSHIYAISPAPTMPETVVFTNAGPFMPPVEVADSGSGN